MRLNLTHPLIEEYRRLVQAPAGTQALEDAVSLVQAIANVQIANPWAKDVADRLEEEEDRDAVIQRHISETLREYLAGSFQDAKLTRRRNRELLELQERCYRVVAALNIPSFPEVADLPDERKSLLLDSALVVFHQAYFALLPDLGPGWKREREYLVDAFLRLATCLPAKVDQHRVLALVYELTGHAPHAAFHYRRALQLSNADAHEFMSLLQAAWAHAVEHGRFHEASELLIDSAVRVKDEDFPELLQLFVETAKLRRAA